MPPFFDTHAHLDFPDFQADLREVIARAAAAGVTRILAIGTDLASSRRVLDLADRFEALFAVVGIHPNHVGDAPDDARAELRELAGHEKVVALGETGLDFHRLPGRSTLEDDALKERQRSLFRQQLEVAAETGLNCVIHQRDAFSETVDLMRATGERVCGVFHCFTGTPEEARQVLALGSLVSFTGVVTFKNAKVVRDALASVPAGRFMLETDCPFLAPIPHRGQRCEPAHVTHIAARAAEIRRCSLEELSAETCATARAFFRGLG